MVQNPHMMFLLSILKIQHYFELCPRQFVRRPLDLSEFGVSARKVRSDAWDVKVIKEILAANLVTLLSREPKPLRFGANTSLHILSTAGGETAQLFTQRGTERSMKPHLIQLSSDARAILARRSKVLL